MKVARPKKVVSSTTPILWTPQETTGPGPRQPLADLTAHRPLTHQLLPRTKPCFIAQVAAVRGAPFLGTLLTINKSHDVLRGGAAPPDGTDLAYPPIKNSCRPLSNAGEIFILQEGTSKSRRGLIRV